MAATISTPIIESIPRSLNVAPSGISSFSAISATRARSSSFRFAFDIVVSLFPLLSLSLLDHIEKVTNGLQAREALVGDLDPQLPLQRPDDLEHSEGVDGQLADDGRLEHVVKVLLHHLCRRRPEHREQLFTRRTGAFLQFHRGGLHSIPFLSSRGQKSCCVPAYAAPPAGVSSWHTGEVVSPSACCTERARGKVPSRNISRVFRRWGLPLEVRGSEASGATTTSCTARPNWAATHAEVASRMAAASPEIPSQQMTSCSSPSTS